MKKFPIILAFLLTLLTLSACHKDKEMDIKEAIVSNEEITVSATQARLSWQVDYVGQYHTGVELSQNENMSDLRRVEATKEEDCFVAVVDSLLVEKKYYYRIVVWNKFGSYEQPVGDFTTSKTFSVHVSAEPSIGGTVAGGGTFAEGDTCTVTAIANTGYNFVNWTENGTQVSTEAEYAFAVINNRNVVAHFTSLEYTITATTDPVEGGVVEGSGGYNYGDECTLRATANDGYDFVNWTKEDGTQVSTNTTYRFTVTETATYIAHFQLKSFTISVSANPAEGGFVEGGGTYEYGQSCTVRVTEATGYHFVNWTENGEQVSSDAEYNFTVTNDRNLVANFTSQQYNITVTANPTNGGSVIGDGTYYEGEQCTVTATPADGYTFTTWYEIVSDEGGVSFEPVSSDANYTFIVTENHSFMAQFELINYSISISAEPSEGGIVAGGGNDFHYGDECTVTATANNGFTFSNWTVNSTVVSTQANYTFTVNGDRILVANFITQPQGTINGLFTINDNGDQVYFSKGNLRYIGNASTPYWNFANNQWDYLGTMLGQNSTDQNAARDLFGWGTSGWNSSGARYYHPWDTDNSNGSFYGPSGVHNLTGGYALADWGMNNPITNGGNQPAQWRTLTQQEWDYVFKRRPGICYAKAQITGTNVGTVNGVILFPDNWNTNTYTPSSYNQSGASFDSNSIPASQWLSLEEAGAVFLPAAGRRNGTSVDDLGSFGYYWSASCSTNSSASTVYFYNSNLHTSSNSYRCYGFSVRLVRSAQ